MYKLPKVNQARGLQSMTTGIQTANLTLPGKNGCVACFVIEKGSSLEMRDCFIVSKKDHKIADAEKELLIEAKLKGCEGPEQGDVEDCCIVLNGQGLSEKIKIGS